MPILTCDPRAGLKSGQFFNPSCFTPPTGMGVNGPIIWPDITGPGYFTSDLGVYKNFKVTERQTLQLRLEMFNFLNHPLPEFDANGSNSDLKLTFENPSGAPTATNMNALTTGTPLNTVGRRVLELSIKYSF
jgi:hypothetical protein